MKLRHLRNATAVLELGEHRLLIDPMLSPRGAMPGFKPFSGQRNPLVPMPEGAEEALASVTAVLLTHEHPDHFDPPALEWIAERGLPVWTHAIDLPNLQRKGLDAHLLEDGAMGMRVEIVPTRHGRGLLGWLMGPVCGFFLDLPGEPTVYITSDAILSEELLDAVDRLQPDVILAPAGAANMGLGESLFSVDELVTLAERSRGQLVFNHLEALDHCPTTRVELRARMDAAGLGARVHIPADGEALEFHERAPVSARVRAREGLRPGFQKWFTAKYAGT